MGSASTDRLIECIWFRNLTKVQVFVLVRGVRHSDGASKMCAARVSLFSLRLAGHARKCKGGGGRSRGQGAIFDQGMATYIGSSSQSAKNRDRAGLGKVKRKWRKIVLGLDCAAGEFRSRIKEIPGIHKQEAQSKRNRPRDNHREQSEKTLIYQRAPVAVARGGWRAGRSFGGGGWGVEEEEARERERERARRWRQSSTDARRNNAPRH
jgi:hypothetical protein